MSASIGDNVWQALPPRKKCRRGQPKDRDGSSSGGGGSCGSSSSGSSSTGSGGSGGAVPTNQEQVAANIASRTEARSKHIQGTLEHRDGCAGEGFEYLDHTADVQCHTWGASLAEALANMAPCMFNYMTDLSMVDADEALACDISVSGHDLHTLLFAYMDEMLFRFSTDLFCITSVDVLKLRTDKDFSLEVRAHGCKFDREKHVQGTEIKAITYSNMQVHEKPDRCDIYVIVDI